MGKFTLVTYTDKQSKEKLTRLLKYNPFEHLILSPLLSLFLKYSKEQPDFKSVKFLADRKQRIMENSIPYVKIQKDLPSTASILDNKEDQKILLKFGLKINEISKC